MKNFRIAIIGAGVWGDTHAAIYCEHPNVEPVAICEKIWKERKCSQKSIGFQEYLIMLTIC